MIIVKWSGEMVTDSMTPDVFRDNSCTKGLPRGCTLSNVIYDSATNIVEYHFDDGKDKETIMTLTYERIK